MRFRFFRIACVESMFFLAISFPAHLYSISARPFSDSPRNATPSDRKASPSGSAESIEIPGPLRSFLRMAGLSQEVTPENLLPTLTRNVSLYGFSGNQEKEYLVLVNRYVRLARDLQHLSGGDGTIRIKGCDDADNLLRIIGYRLQQECGQRNTALITANAERAFLTIDSGFPLTALEQALQKNEAFMYSFPVTRVPILFTQSDWISATKWKPSSPDENLLDLLLHDHDADRLYAAMARFDDETRLALDHSPGLKKLMPLAAVLDLYGGQITIRSSRVLLPGGTNTQWEDLVGASPNSPGEFVTRLLTKDSGWLAAYFDVLSRLNDSEQSHITREPLLKRFYGAYRSTATRVAASKGVYPRNGDLLVLLASLKWKQDGDLEIPGDLLGVWDQILSEMAKSREIRPWLGRGREWNTTGRLLETLVASSNYRSESGPVQVFLLLNAINTARPPGRGLSDESAKLLAHRFPQFRYWFPIFAEFPALEDSSIALFVNAADRADHISNSTLRTNALGSLQANIGLWQILARQGQIPPDQLNSSWQGVVQPFLAVGSSVQLFDAARSSLQSAFQAATGHTNLSQEEVIGLLAGPTHDDPDSQRVHQQLAERIRAVLEDQRLASLDTLFGLNDGLLSMEHGAQIGPSLLPLAESLREFEMPRPIFTGNERTSWAPVVYTSRHAELQVKTDLTRVLKSSASASQLESSRGQLTPFLRDTLVGLNYAYYEPPGAEVLHNNPLFVRSHDFSSMSVQGVEEIWGTPRLVGVGATAGGGAYLLGSLAELPYALAFAEKDFIIPRNVQALIWQEVVPDLLVGATLPRWWNVSPQELHLAALYQQAGEELLTHAASDPDLRAKVFAILSDRVARARLERTERSLGNPETVALAISETPPSDLFYLALEYHKRYPDDDSQWSKAGSELTELSRKYPSEASWERLSADFGVPHPALLLTNSCSLLNMKATFTFRGDAGRIFAESWDSNNLYWARLADEMGYAPVELNLLVPELTRNMISNVFASNIDDWPALLHALEETGNEFRRGKIAQRTATAMTR